MKAGQDEPTAIQRTRSSSAGPRTGPAYLTVLTGQSVGTVFELPVGTTIIGRGQDARVMLRDDGVSRRHAEIIRDPDGSAKLVDLQSTNGTFINGRRIHAEGLREGDRLRIGQSATLDFRYTYRESGLVEMRTRDVDAGVPTPVQRSSSEQLRGSYDNLAATLDSLSKVYVRQGQHDAAIAAYRRTLEIREMKFGKDHPAVAAILDSLGESLCEAGELEPALECHERALAIYESQSQRPPRETGHVLAHLGRCQLSLGRGATALASLERAHALLRSHGAASAELARVRFDMAKALAHLGRDPERMLDLAQLARDAFAAGGRDTRDQYAAVHEWLSARGET
ncbi:MAG: tetratricopeptide repeat protein [Deltaproteobacteria bacterium]|nr:tetratricopeptide repeat protein [Deltaproteobacteria bacterium]